MTSRKHNEQRGYALLLVLAVTALIAPLGLFALLQARVDLLLARHARMAAQLFYAAESGLDNALADLRLEPVFDRLLAGPDGKEGTGDEAAFPFLKPPPATFPRPPFRYEVTVEHKSESRVEIVSRATAERGVAQVVSATVLRDTAPMLGGALWSTIGGKGFFIGGEFRIDGTDEGTHGNPLPAVAVRDDETAHAIRDQLSPEAARHLLGAGGTPSVHALPVPDGTGSIDSLLRDPRARMVAADETNALGSGLLVSRGALYIDRAFGDGILVVDGDLYVSEELVFDGMILVIGDVVFERGSTVTIRGVLWQLGNPLRLDLLGKGEILLDRRIVEDLDSAFGSILPRRAIVTGWREELD